MEITVEQVSPFSVEADGLAYAGTSTGTMSDGMGEKILARTGGDLLEETLATAPIAVGAATVVEVSGLKAASVIYAPMRLEPGDRLTVENVRRCTRAVLVAANFKRMASVVIQAITPESDEMSQAEVARAMLDELQGFRPTGDLAVFLVHEEAQVIDGLNRLSENNR